MRPLLPFSWMVSTSFFSPGTNLSSFMPAENLPNLPTSLMCRVPGTIRPMPVLASARYLSRCLSVILPSASAMLSIVADCMMRLASST